jgi:hypothetical protein
MPAIPGVSGALLNQSYGDIGEIGEPSENLRPSGGVVPGPFVAWSIKTFDPLALIVKRGVGSGEGDGEDTCPAVIPSVASRIMPNATRLRLRFSPS